MSHSVAYIVVVVGNHSGQNYSRGEQGLQPSQGIWWIFLNILIQYVLDIPFFKRSKFKVSK